MLPRTCPMQGPPLRKINLHLGQPPTLFLCRPTTLGCIPILAPVGSKLALGCSSPVRTPLPGSSPLGSQEKGPPEMLPGPAGKARGHPSISASREGMRRGGIC